MRFPPKLHVGILPADLVRLRAGSSRMASPVQIVQFCAHAGAPAPAVVASGEVGQAHRAAGDGRVGAARAYPDAAAHSHAEVSPARLAGPSVTLPGCPLTWTIPAWCCGLAKYGGLSWVFVIWGCAPGWSLERLCCWLPD